MKNRIILIAVALLSILLVAPADPPEFKNYFPYVTKTCPTLTILRIDHAPSGHAPFSNIAQIDFFPEGSCVDAIEVYDAKTGGQLGAGNIYWENRYDHFEITPGDFEFYPIYVSVWFPVGAAPAYYDIRFVLHFRDGCVAEVTGGFTAEEPQGGGSGRPPAVCPML